MSHIEKTPCSNNALSFKSLFQLPGLNTEDSWTRSPFTSNWNESRPYKFTTFGSYYLFIILPLNSSFTQSLTFVWLLVRGFWLLTSVERNTATGWAPSDWLFHELTNWLTDYLPTVFGQRSRWVSKCEASPDNKRRWQKRRVHVCVAQTPIHHSKVIPIFCCLLYSQPQRTLFCSCYCSIQSATPFPCSVYLVVLCHMNQCHGEEEDWRGIVTRDIWKMRNFIVFQFWTEWRGSQISQSVSMSLGSYFAHSWWYDDRVRETYVQ